MDNVQTPRVTETQRLSAHRAQVELVRASLIAVPAVPSHVPHQTQQGRA